MNNVKIASFYRFAPMPALERIKAELLLLMEEFDINGTIIIADEGFNGTVAGLALRLDAFLPKLVRVLGAEPEFKLSYSEEPVFARRKVKIKKEIVTLRKNVDIKLGKDTHVDPSEWNRLISDPDVIVLDARNDYEFKVGTFRGALNAEAESFGELPEFLEQTLDPQDQPKIAMFCTGGIRCEKLAPYLIEKGFRNVYQLKGGILKYLEEVDPESSLWEGECFVFDERITLKTSLEPGSGVDYSAGKKSSRNEREHSRSGGPRK